MIEFDEEKQNLKIAELRQKEEEDFAQAAAANRGLSYFNLSRVPLEMDAIELIPEAQAREAQAVAFQLLKKEVGLAVINPDNAKVKELVDSLSSKGYSVKVFLVSKKSLDRALDKYSEISKVSTTRLGSFDVSGSEIDAIIARIHTVSDIAKEIQLVLSEKKGSSTTEIVEIMLAGALAMNTSDIHLEPQEKDVRLRFRLDGVLNDILTFDSHIYSYFLSRVKLVSGLKLNLKTVAQDGRFSIKASGLEIEVRVSIIPGNYGESIVMRVLNPNAISVSMEELGLEPRLHKILEHELERPNGMILNTGPTGSGKTTTLYAFLKKVHKPDIKIITIEHPVEYHLAGIVQTQTDPEKGYSFGDGLRAALRQDPDIIMVGEIRDTETAETAVAAASTGHLVFSTLHTNNAAGTFPRLLTLGVNPKVMSSAVTVAMAQRLARKLCKECKKETSLAGEDKKLVEKMLSEMPFEEYKDIQKEKVWVPVGCAKCNNTGYKGRVGIFEAVLMTPEIESVVLQNPSEHEVKKAAHSQKIPTMPQDGIIKALKGTTSFEELRRVLDFESEG